MSIPMSILLDIGGKKVLEFEAVSDLLKCVEKENLFANFPIGATIQDSGKRKLISHFVSFISFSYFSYF